jgi:hypothetical protein
VTLPGPLGLTDGLNEARKEGFTAPPTLVEAFALPLKAVAAVTSCPANPKPITVININKLTFIFSPFHD